MAVILAALYDQGMGNMHNPIKLNEYIDKPEM